MANFHNNLVLGFALLIDLTLGDPPNRWHPVAWMGLVIVRAKRHVPRQGHLHPFLYGLTLDLVGGSIVAVLGRQAERIAHRILMPGVLAESFLLKSAFAVRSLTRAAGEVHCALAKSDLPEARRLVRWHLVSRETASLSEELVAAATIESVAENASDSFVAPIFYYTLFGLPGTFAYRFLNTADAMLGYRDPGHEWLGKAIAWLDDIVNFIPARLTAALLMVAAWLCGEDAAGAWRIWRRDAGRTASPNAGHPMSAMAGALGVELEKEGVYRLGEGSSRPTAAHIPRAVRLMQRTLGLAALLASVGLLLRGKRYDTVREATHGRGV